MKSIFKYRVVLLIILSGTLLFGKIYTDFYTNQAAAAQNFQDQFLKKELSLNRFIEIQCDLMRHRTDFANWKNHSDHPSNYLHIFSGDSLIYWNTNRVPIRQFADIHFPAEGILHLQNGWYYAKQIKENDITICASFLIREEYPYENKNIFTKENYTEINQENLDSYIFQKR